MPKSLLKLVLSLLLVALLGGCGDLPRPFAGNPGATARRLSQPPPARLAVPPPTAALLADNGGAALADALAKALQDQEVPAVAGPPHSGDWRLVTTAELHERDVIPVFTVQDPAGADQGAAQGVAVPGALWADAAPGTLQGVAKAAAPDIALLLTRIEAARLRSDPNSLLNRPARVYFKGVHGAPGDGDLALAQQLKSQLPGLGPVVQDTPAGADYTLDCQVATAPLPGNHLRVEIQWVVDDAQGREAGRVAQLNEVPAGALSHYWGEVAVAVVQEAANGIREVLVNQIAARAGGAAPEPRQGAPPPGPSPGAPPLDPARGRATPGPS
jgi:hypothetical protein